MKVSLLSLLAIKLKDLYLTKSSTSKITILMDESLIEERTSWLGSLFDHKNKSFS